LAEDRRSQVGDGAGEAAGSAELREAVSELQQYLSDRVPPLMVVDSVALLVQQPPQLLAAEIGAWVAYQRPAAADPDPVDGDDRGRRGASVRLARRVA